MNKLTLFALTLISTSMLIPAQDAQAAVKTIDCGNGVYVSVGQGNNLQDLQSILNSINPSSNQTDWKDCLSQIPGFSGNMNPQFPTQELPIIPDVPDNFFPETNLPDNNFPDADLPGNNRPGTDLPGNNNNNNNKPDTSLPDSSTPGSSNSNQAFAEEVVRLVNQERSKAGLSPLTVNTGTQAAAAKRAKEIQTSFSHTRPDGKSFSTALTEAGVSFSGSGENIAWGQTTPQEVMNSWMNSAGHRANILNPNFRSIGVGHYQNTSGTQYWTQLFIQ